MISLRTMEGLDLKMFEANFGTDERRRVEKGLQKFTSSNLLRLQNEFVQLTDEGMLRADGVASALFV